MRSEKDDENYEITLFEKGEKRRMTLAMPLKIAMALYQQLKSDFKIKK